MQLPKETNEVKDNSQVTAPGLLGLLGSPVSSWVSFGKQRLDETRPESLWEDYFSSDVVATSGSSSSTDEDGMHSPTNSGVRWNNRDASAWNWSEKPIDRNSISSASIIPPPSDDEGIEVGLSENVGNEITKDSCSRKLPPLSHQQRSISGSSSESDKNERPRVTRTVNRPITRPRRSKSKAPEAIDDSSHKENIRNRSRSQSRSRRTNNQRTSRSESRTHTSRRSRSTSRARALNVPNSNISRSSSRTRERHVTESRRSRSKSRTRTTTGLRARSQSRPRDQSVSLHERGRISNRSIIPTRRAYSSPPISPAAEVLSPPRNGSQEQVYKTEQEDKVMKAKQIKIIKPEQIKDTKIEDKEEVVLQLSLKGNESEGLTRRSVPTSTAKAQVNCHGKASIVHGLPRRIQTRSLLTTSVYHNQATGIWITTINMSQKSNVTKSNAAKYLKAFSFLTEREARESAYANAPAKMHPFTENPNCFSCDQKFSVFKRASHCRNCGVCVCNSCSVSWSKVALPETYNIKNEKMVKVCKSCNTLSKLFRQALLDANYEDALIIYNTGNINLRCPFINAQTNEVMLPIHCAVEGGSIILLKWLVDVHYCPIKRIRTGNRNKTQHAEELIATSKGRTVLEIAMSGQKVDILRYLINEKNLSILGLKDLHSSLAALEVVLKSIPTFPEESSDDEDYDPNEVTPIRNMEHARRYNIKDNLPNYNISTMDDESTDSTGGSPVECDSDDEESVVTTVDDAVRKVSSRSFHLFIFYSHLLCPFYSVLFATKILSTVSVPHADTKFVA